MIFRKPPRWLRTENNLIPIEKIESIRSGTYGCTKIFLVSGSVVEVNSSVDEIHYFLKHGKPKKRRAL